jgi:hypothetical protein
MFYGLISGVQSSYGITQGDYKHSWPHRVTLWAIIATHLWAKMLKNGSKQVYDDTYIHNPLFYTQVYSIGQQVVFNYPMVSPKVPTTLMTLYSYPMGHHGPLICEPKLLKTVENKSLTILTSTTSYSIHKYVLWVKKWCSIILAITQGAFNTHDPK